MLREQTWGQRNTDADIEMEHARAREQGGGAWHTFTSQVDTIGQLGRISLSQLPHDKRQTTPSMLQFLANVFGLIT